MIDIVYKWIANIQSHCLPTQCLLCGAQSDEWSNLCRGCRADLPWVQEVCPRCAAPVLGSVLCTGCQQQAPSFDRTYAPCRYRPPVSDLIQRLKFHGVLAAAPALGSVLSRWLQEHLSSYPDAVLPVPLHPERVRERGYNQAVEIGRIVAKQLALPLLVSGATRTRPTKPQSTLASKRERHANLRHAFQLRHDFGENTHIAILDDVMTSGATVQALAGTLRRAGVARVDVWICGRAG